MFFLSFARSDSYFWANLCLFRRIYIPKLDPVWKLFYVKMCLNDAFWHFSRAVQINDISGHIPTKKVWRFFDVPLLADDI